MTDPFIVLVAYTEEQSDELAYGALRAILAESAIAKDFDIGLERIMRKRGDGKAVSVAGSPNARDGARTTFQVFDETHRLIRAALKQAHQTMMANLPKRKVADPWALEITTAPEPGAGSVAEDTMAYSAAVKDGRIADASLFFFHRQADDSHDLTTEAGARAAVIEASGPAAAWRDIDGIVGLWKDPTTDRTYWERVYCNRLVKGETQAFDVERFKVVVRPSSPVKRGDVITIGFDGSQVDDSTGLIGTHVETGYQWKLGFWERPYGSTGNGWQVPTAEVDAAVRDAFATYDVFRMYADPWFWGSWIAKWCGEFGKDRVVEWFTNRPLIMSRAIESFESAIREGLVSHSGDRDVIRHIANSRKRTIHQRDDTGRLLFVIQKDRADSPNKIDLAMAAILSWDARTHAIASGVSRPPKKYMPPKIWTPNGFRPVLG